ncbi:hypothetical protein [Rhodococcus jostii]|uniref:Uncharacterized protein n=1 Tax=Rhodococcus jostii TaxID=132919 RepID=A0A1H5EE98_RHOJO|nr:hypothetical protein [Rhodococcus jostii]SED89409.1 hypothetical protein SAMN04490220_5944 [Rhodococcus jostii]
MCTADVTGIYLTWDVDQEFLAEQREHLNSFVVRGGRVVVNGHVQRIFLDGLTRWRKLEFRNPSDLALTRVTEHPVWAGSDPKAFLYNTGRRGPVPFAELERIGVAGFYGRGCYLDLPDGAKVVHTIGRTRAPIDYENPLGAGRVLVHGGNDLLQSRHHRLAAANHPMAGSTMTRAATVAFLHGGSHAQLATLADPALEPYRIRPVHVRTGDLDDIRDVDVLVVADRLRADLLTRWTEAITDRLGGGATVIVFGENKSGDWLPGVREDSRPTVFWWWRTGEDHRLRQRSPDHPAWDYLSEHGAAEWCGEPGRPAHRGRRVRRFDPVRRRDHHCGAAARHHDGLRSAPVSTC